MYHFRLLSISILLYLSTVAQGQALLTMEGQVLNELDQPLVAAAYQIVNGPGGITDDQGRFIISLPPADSVELRIRYLGYQSWIQTIILPASAPVIIRLQPSIYALQTLELIGTWAESDAPFTVSQMTAEDIEPLNMGQDIPYLLRYTPGVVSTSDAGTGIGYTGIRIRGSDPTRTNVTINGVPVNDAESQAVFWVNMPDLISSVDHVQVQRGAGTSTNGAGAFGATINLQTQTLRTEAYGGLSTSVGSFGTRRATLEAGTGLLKEHWTMDTRWSMIESDGYIDRATARLRSFYTALAWQDDRTLVRLLAFSGKERTYQSWWGTPQSRLDNEEEAMLIHAANNGLTPGQTHNLLTSGRTYNYYEYENEVDQYGQDNIQLQFSRALNDHLRINATAHYTHGEGYFEQFRLQDERSAYGLGPVIVGQDTISTTDLVRRRWLENDFIGGVANLRYESSRFKVHLGGAWNIYQGDHFGRIIWAEYAQGIQPDHEYYRGDATKTDGNVFLKADWQVARDWRLFGDLQVRQVDYRTSGVDNDLRSYDVKEGLTFFNPKGGVTWAARPDVEVYGSVAVANREPSRSDYVDAPELAHPRPERLVDFEVGSRISWKGWHWNVNGYWMDYTDQLVPTGALNDVGATLKTNVPDSYRLGVEIEAAGDLGFGLGYKGSLGISRNRIPLFEEIIYDYTSGFEEVRIEHRDVDIAFSPEWVYSHQLSWDGWKGFGLIWMSQLVGKQYLDNTSNEDRSLKSWSVQDIQVHWARQIKGIGEIQVRFQVNNVLDELYSSNGYTYSYIYGDPVTENFYYPQAGRNWIAGVSVTW
ncbi:MAG: TonB-dependent receptor [Saprospiraceae bacterium]|nr:TonB-dependent receptor [Saprospiraceae bacterium]